MKFQVAHLNTAHEEYAATVRVLVNISKNCISGGDMCSNSFGEYVFLATTGM